MKNEGKTRNEQINLLFLTVPRAGGGGGGGGEGARQKGN